MKRLQHRFLWMVVLVLWISLRNQKVKMHMDRQMREIIIPSWVIRVRMVWWATSWEANGKEGVSIGAARSAEVVIIIIIIVIFLFPDCHAKNVLLFF